MTTRHAGYVVTLKEDLREDDAEDLIKAIQLLRPVLSVTPVVANIDQDIAEERARWKLREQLFDVVLPKAKP